jgi:pimeloyl-ACP methyl ester carboxylesterase
MKLASLPIRTGRLKVGSGSLFWHEVGQGEALVLLHGSWQDSLQWLPLLSHLGPDFHCLAPDLLGFGESRADLRTAYSVQLQVEALADWLQALRIQRCVLVGQAVGGWVAAQLALQHPSLVKGLVVLEPEGLEPTLRRQRWRQRRRWAGRLSPFAISLRLLAPLLLRVGGQAWLQRLSLQQEQRQFPAASRILFNRRPAEVKAELVHERLAQLRSPATLLLPQTLTPSQEMLGKAFVRSLPTTTLLTLADGPTPWGIDVAESAATIRAIAAPLLSKRRSG